MLRRLGPSTSAHQTGLLNANRSKTHASVSHRRRLVRSNTKPFRLQGQASLISVRSHAHPAGAHANDKPLRGKDLPHGYAGSLTSSSSMRHLNGPSHWSGYCHLARNWSQLARLIDARPLALRCLRDVEALVVVCLLARQIGHIALGSGSLRLLLSGECQACPIRFPWPSRCSSSSPLPRWGCALLCEIPGTPSSSKMRASPCDALLRLGFDPERVASSAISRTRFPSSRSLLPCGLHPSSRTGRGD